MVYESDGKMNRILSEYASLLGRFQGSINDRRRYIDIIKKYIENKYDTPNFFSYITSSFSKTSRVEKVFNEDYVNNFPAERLLAGLRIHKNNNHKREYFVDWSRDYDMEDLANTDQMDDLNLSNSKTRKMVLSELVREPTNHINNNKFVFFKVTDSNGVEYYRFDFDKQDSTTGLRHEHLILGVVAYYLSENMNAELSLLGSFLCAMEDEDFFISGVFDNREDYHNIRSVSMDNLNFDLRKKIFFKTLDLLLSDEYINSSKKEEISDEDRNNKNFYTIIFNDRFC